VSHTAKKNYQPNFNDAVARPITSVKILTIFNQRVGCYH